MNMMKWFGINVLLLYHVFFPIIIIIREI